jgi:hypothetical protein
MCVIKGLRRASRCVSCSSQMAGSGPLGDACKAFNTSSSRAYPSSKALERDRM